VSRDRLVSRGLRVRVDRLDRRVCRSPRAKGRAAREVEV
jgi:hypothetical protein